MAVYTTIDDSEANFQCVTWTGNGSNARTITLPGTTDMQPDFIWVKNRSDAEDHCLMDVVRTFAVDKAMRSNGADEEGGVGTTARGWVQATSDGVGCYNGSTNANLVNASSDLYVAWNWKAGTSFSNDASSTSVGSIDSAGSVSTAAGFSIMSYTGTGSTATFAHGLGAVPKMIIFKNRTVGGSQWDTYHHNVGTAHRLYLEATSAKASATNFINNTAPTSSVITVGDATHTNGDGNSHIAYCFAEKQGYSKFGSFVASNPVFVHCGFKPAFVMIKRHTATGNWHMLDNKRILPFNPQDPLYANANTAEQTDDHYDLVSNGFVVRNAAGGGGGDSGTAIFMAFAESPFVNSNGVPTTAR